MEVGSIFVGIDVSKARLDMAMRPLGESDRPAALIPALWSESAPFFRGFFFASI